MPSTPFSLLLRKLRAATGLTMREFCLKNGFDPGNFSRLERGLYPPPNREDLLERYATALGLAEGGDSWIEFFDVAAASKGQIPKDLLSDVELLEKLPALFRTLRGRPMPPEKLDEFIEDVRRS